MNNLNQFLLRRLKAKHQKLSTRFLKGVEEGNFQQLSKRRRYNVVERLKKLERQISDIGRRTDLKIRLNFKHWAVALALGVVVSATAQAQEQKQTIKRTFKDRLQKSKVKATTNARTEAISTFTEVFQLGDAAPQNAHPGDFDLDGDLDVLYVPYIGGPFMKINNGSSVFTESAPLLDAVIVSSLVGDFDGDGDLDLLYISYPSYNAYLGLNDGNGNFSASSVTVPSYTNCIEGIVGDIDGDGDDDLLIERYCGYDSPSDPYSSSGFKFWINNGSAFVESTELISGGVGQSEYLGLVDIDGDSDLDIPIIHRTLASNSGAPYYNYVPGASSFKAFLNDGSGNFSDAPFDIDPYIGSYNGGSARLGDFDGDGDVDVIWIENGQHYLLANDGAANFVAQSPVAAPPFLYTPNFGQKVIDMNNDTFADIVTDGISGDSTVIWQGDGLGGFSQRFKISGDFGVADFNGDGLQDLLNFDGNMIILDNQGSFSFTEQAEPLVIISQTYDIKVADVDGDGDMDILQAGAANANRIWLNDGTGTNFTISQDFPYSDDTEQIEINDLDIDGDIDFVALSGYQDIYYIDRTSLSLFSNTAGTFTEVNEIQLSGYEQRFKLADIDSDGDADIVISAESFGNSYLKTLLNNGGLNFAALDSISTPFHGLFEIGDIDGDTDLDIVIAARSNGIQILSNNGAGAFSTGGLLTATGYGAYYSFESINLGDFDGDGDLDIFTSYGYEGSQGVGLFFTNDGSGNFNQAAGSLASGYFYRSNIADLDGDGDTDIITGGYLSQPKTWDNDGAGNFTEGPSIDLLADEYSLPSFADFDNDGDTDMVFSGVYTPNVVFLNDAITANPLEADSLALVAFYDATNGDNWTDNTNWKTGDVNTWFGVTATADNVTNIALPGNNLDGAIPAQFANLDALISVDLSGNLIDDIQGDFSVNSSITSFDLSDNKLDFGDFEQLSNLTEVTIGTQTTDDQALNQKLPSGSPVSFSFLVDGANNSYKWFKNGAELAGETTNTINIASLDRTNMGDYYCEATSTTPGLEGLTLTSATITTLATASITGTLKISSTDPATVGEVQLLEVQDVGGYDTLGVTAVSNVGAYAFNDVVLSDFVLVGIADTITHPGALPTYYTQTVFWEEADTLKLETNEVIAIVSVFYTNPNDPVILAGTFNGYLEEEIPDGGRTEARGRVSGAGVSLRRGRRSSRTEGEGELAYYIYTNENGEFSLAGVEPGEYNVDIQYPGYPMDVNSFINITIGEGVKDKDVSVEAVVDQGKIAVRQLIILGADGPTNGLVLFPNPTSELLKVLDNENRKNLKVEIFNMTGQKMKHIFINDDGAINVSKLPMGQYLVRIKNEKGIELLNQRVLIE